MGLKFHRDLIRLARSLGAEDLRIEPGARHPKLAGRRGGRCFRIAVPCSPGDRRTGANLAARLRRLLSG